MKASQEGRSAKYGEEDANLFLTYGKVDPNMKETWLLDSGASKHMMSKGELFAHIDDSFKTKKELVIIAHCKLKVWVPWRFQPKKE